MMISPSPLKAELLPSWLKTKLPVLLKVSLRASFSVKSLHPSWPPADPLPVSLKAELLTSLQKMKLHVLPLKVS